MTADNPRESGRPRRPRDDVPAELATELATLRRAQRDLDGIARESAEVLSELAPQVDQLAEQLDALRSGQPTSTTAPSSNDAASAVKAELGMLAVPPGPWCWPLLARDPAAHADAWQALTTWVAEVLVPGYELTRGQLPDCWTRHPRMVNELTALRTGYLEAHAPDAAATLSLDWHHRGLPAALAAMRETIPRETGLVGRDRPLCGPGRHLASVSSVSDVDEDELRAQHATAEHWRAPSPLRATG